MIQGTKYVNYWAMENIMARVFRSVLAAKSGDSHVVADGMIPWEEVDEQDRANRR